MPWGTFIYVGVTLFARSVLILYSKPEWWELEFHDGAVWKALGREGFWKCRSTPDASMAEQMCKLCHNSQDDERKPAAATAKNDPSVAERRKKIQEFMDYYQKESIEKLKASILEMTIKPDKPGRLETVETMENPDYLQYSGLQSEELPIYSPSFSSISSSSTATDDAYAADNESTKKNC